MPISERFEIKDLSFDEAITHPVLSIALEDFHDRLHWSKDKPAAVHDRYGKSYSQKLEAGQDPHVIAGRLTKTFRSARRGDKDRVSGFNRPIHYPKLGIV